MSGVLWEILHLKKCARKSRGYEFCQLTITGDRKVGRGTAIGEIITDRFGFRPGVVILGCDDRLGITGEFVIPALAAAVLSHQSFHVELADVKHRSQETS